MLARSLRYEQRVHHLRERHQIVSAPPGAPCRGALQITLQPVAGPRNGKRQQGFVLRAAAHQVHASGREADAGAHRTKPEHSRSLRASRDHPSQPQRRDPSPWNPTSRVGSRSCTRRGSGIRRPGRMSRPRRPASGRGGLGSRPWQRSTGCHWESGERSAGDSHCKSPSALSNLSERSPQPVGSPKTQTMSFVLRSIFTAAAW